MAPSPDVLTPSRLNKLVEQALKANLPATLTVRGEISNFTRNRNSGHLYFTIKDDSASVDCVMFAGRALYLRFDPQDGQEVLVTGNIGVYVPRGRYQIVVGAIEPVGVGNLELARRQIEARLREEGLFDPDRKRELPRYPRKLAIVTSKQAAGYADILKVLDRCPALLVTLYDVPVQGPTAAPAIVGTLRRIARDHAKKSFDVLMIARGGGSLEDLWAFNDEALARVLATMPMPTITGIGHEIDVSIADLVADHHAHTPTEAATVVASNWIRAGDLLLAIGQRITRLVMQVFNDAKSRLQYVERHEFIRKPQTLFNVHAQRLDDLEQSLNDTLSNRFQREQSLLTNFSARLIKQHPAARLHARRLKLDTLAQQLELTTDFRVRSTFEKLDAYESRLRALNPKSVLDRGYSITRLKSSGEVLTRVDQIRGGQKLVTQLSDGEVESIANDPKQPELF
ncbi:MAG TPA: exodeoxyribonuclease VII large subunit [Tepidisphaeraceae bacterium]|nr:exodeoxyribonuclease VII large subunit [Tepidisphaeraceae bacterium]